MPAVIALPRVRGGRRTIPRAPLNSLCLIPPAAPPTYLPRIMQDWLTRRWGQPIVIENKPGAAGNIGVETASKCRPRRLHGSGYGALANDRQPEPLPEAQFRSRREFVPVSIIATIPTALIVSPRIAANTMAGIHCLCARPIQANVTAATQGNGTTSHLTVEPGSRLVTDTKFLIVPYRGSGPALTDMIAGNVDIDVRQSWHLAAAC